MPVAIPKGMLRRARPVAELGDRPARGDPPDRGMSALIGEPHVAGGPDRQLERLAAASQPSAELGDAAIGRDPPDRGPPAVVGEPQIAVVAGDDRERQAAAVQAPLRTW